MTRTRVAALIVVLAIAGVTLDLAMGADPPGYGLMLGLGGSVGVIAVTTWIGNVWLRRPDPGADPREESDQGA